MSLKFLQKVLHTIDKLNLVSKDWVSDKTWLFENKEWKIKIGSYGKGVAIDIWWNDFEIQSINCDGEECIKLFEEYKNKFKENLKDRIFTKFLQL